MSSEKSKVKIKEIIRLLRSKDPEAADRLESYALATTQHLRSGNRQARVLAEQDLEQEVRQLADKIPEAKFLRHNISLSAVIIASVVLLE